VSRGDNDGVLLSFDFAGSLAWAQQVGGTDNDIVDAVCSTPNGLILASGRFQDEASFGQQGNSTSLTSRGSHDVFAARFSVDGTLHWAQQAGGALQEIPYAITCLSDGSFGLTGFFTTSATFGTAGAAVELASPGPGRGRDIFFVRYNADGDM
jgi:hypothetical protein